MSATGFYLDFFGLHKRPFTLLPDPDFMFWSDQHKHGFAVLEYGVLSRAPITVLTGEIGAGKTTLVQMLLGRIEEAVTVGLISNAQGGRGEMLQWVLNALGVTTAPEAGYVQMFQALQEFLVAEYAAGRRAVLIFDEAQNLSREGLEELRMLTNINSNQDELIQLILVGQPELRELILDPRMQQLTQRVAASFHLDRMSRENVTLYIRHRLVTAGGDGSEFSDGACGMVSSYTRGVPRLVNQLCDFAMLYAWTNEEPEVTEKTVQAVIDDDVFFGRHSLAEEKRVQNG
ncbi:ExeA family protein (plasmid) [Roseobacteraceae bacterium NS-SX3]